MDGKPPFVFVSVEKSTLVIEDTPPGWHGAQTGNGVVFFNGKTPTLAPRAIYCVTFPKKNRWQVMVTEVSDNARLLGQASVVDPAEWMNKILSKEIGVPKMNTENTHDVPKYIDLAWAGRGEETHGQSVRHGNGFSNLPSPLEGEWCGDNGIYINGLIGAIYRAEFDKKGDRFKVSSSECIFRDGEFSHDAIRDFDVLDSMNEVELWINADLHAFLGKYTNRKFVQLEENGDLKKSRFISLPDGITGHWAWDDRAGFWLEEDEHKDRDDAFYQVWIDERKDRIKVASHVCPAGCVSQVRNFEVLSTRKEVEDWINADLRGYLKELKYL